LISNDLVPAGSSGRSETSARASVALNSATKRVGVRTSGTARTVVVITGVAGGADAK
jgi:hypothetical protein